MSNSGLKIFTVFLLMGIAFSYICTYCNHQDQLKPHRAVEELWHKQGVKSYEACHEWAFHDASDINGFNPFTAYLTWNNLHSNLFILRAIDYLQDSYKHIGIECARRGL